MEGYAVLMACFAGFLLLYAALLAKTTDVQLIPRHYAAKIKNKKQYARGVAKVVALVALAPLASALTALVTDAALPSLIVLIIGFILMLWLGIRMNKKSF